MKDCGNKAAPAVSEGAPQLPKIGLCKWRDIAPLVGVCREKFRMLGLDGRAPRTIQLGRNCAFYRCEEVHRWIADPLGYRAAPAEQKAA